MNREKETKEFFKFFLGKNLGNLKEEEKRDRDFFWFLFLEIRKKKSTQTKLV